MNILDKIIILFLLLLWLVIIIEVCDRIVKYTVSCIIKSIDWALKKLNK